MIADRIRTLLQAIFPLGISARLSLSLAAIAALAITANLVAERSALVLHVNAAHSANDEPLVAPHPSAVSSSVAATPLAVIPDRRVTDAARAALIRFESAARRRGDEKSEVSSGELAVAKAELVGAASLYAKQAQAAGSTFDRSLRLYIQRGEDLVRETDALRAASADYVQHLEAMDAILEAQIDAAWHVFGRVVARQSLLQLRSDLQEVRQRFEPFRLKNAASAGEEAALTARESALAADLQMQAGATHASKRSPWIDALQVHVEALAALRKVRAGLPDVVERDSHALTMQRAALWAQLNASMDSTAKPVPAASRAPAAPAAAVATLSPAASWMPHEAAQHAILARPNSDARSFMAAVTVLVLLGMAVISYLTVRSVAVPVRRILRATADLADGDVKARVARGGIRELDKLAVAFNDMAGRLSAAHELSRQQHDNLESKVLERTHKLRQLADQDPLTSLANRRRLLGLLNEALADAKVKNRIVGVFFLDIDNFKNYNDGMGHVFGDRVIMSVANRLEELAEGIGFVARFGGDEFTFVYESAPDEKAVYDVGAQLIDAFHSVLAVDDRELSVSVSVGASLYPSHAASAEDLLRAADSALFRAKELGRSQLAMFTPALTESAALRFQTEQGLRRAFERQEFELVYQPEVDLATFEVGVVEALLRWRQPSGALVGPGEFLTVAEQSGLIVEINEWVLEAAITAASEWHHGAWARARVAVNITPRQLLDERFTDTLLELLDKHRLPRHCIELELTESVLQTGSSTIATLHRLQASGIAVALDDFGTGYSSLTSLEQLPLSRIKLDRSLIQNVDSSTRSAAIAHAILDLSTALDLDVTAEGIERPEQFAWLASQRPMHLQGYLFARPLERSAIVAAVAAMPQTMQDLFLALPGRPPMPRVLTALPQSTRVRDIKRREIQR